MAPRKQAPTAAQDSQAGPSQRPRRSVKPKSAYAPKPSESDDGSTSEEQEEQQAPRRGRATSQKAASAETPAARRSSRRAGGTAVNGATGSRPARAAATSSKRGGKESKAAAAAADPDTGPESSSDSSEDESSSDSDGDAEPSQPDQGAKTRGRASKGVSRGAATGTGAAAQKAAVAAVPARSRAGAAAAKPAAAGATAAAAAAAALQPDGARHRHPGATSAAHDDAEDDEDLDADEDEHAMEEAEKEDEDTEQEEEEEEEEDEHAAVAGSQRTALGAARGGGRGGRGAKQLLPPTAAESRKRLFELLERRIGGATGGGGGAAAADGGVRRVLYGDLPAKNANKKARLMADLRSQFDDWHSRLRSKFSVLLYGFGSKRGLLDEFARLLAGPRNRGDAAVLVFHGYNPRCTAREVVTAVAGALMQRSFRHVGTAAGGAAAGGGGGGGGGGSHGALRGLVDEIRGEPPDRHAFVVIHNLDGPGLRPDVSLLSALAACPQVHLIASVDHALAPLLWDSADAARFRWQYINATTFQPYLAETSGAPSVLMGAFKSGVVTAGAGTVLRSLVLGAQEVFKVLAQHLLDDEECEGVAFAHLYRMCRERYLVRDERVLRQHLVEFVDHALVRLRPASDNSGELLTIPMARPDMQAVLDDLEAARRE